MCLNGNTVLKPLEELTSGGDCLAFICDLDGKEIGEEQYLQLSCLSAARDFYIGTWTKSVSLTDQIKGIRRLLLAFCGGFLVLMTALAVALQRVLYRPIRRWTPG